VIARAHTGNPAGTSSVARSSKIRAKVVARAVVVAKSAAVWVMEAEVATVSKSAGHLRTRQ